MKTDAAEIIKAIKKGKSLKKKAAESETESESESESDSDSEESDEEAERERARTKERERLKKEREKEKELKAAGKEREKEKEKERIKAIKSAEKEKARSQKSVESPKPQPPAIGDLLGDFGDFTPPANVTPNCTPIAALGVSGNRALVDGWGELEDFFSSVSVGSKPVETGKEQKNEGGKEKKKEEKRDDVEEKKQKKRDKKMDLGTGPLDNASLDARIKKRGEDKDKERAKAVLAQLEAQCGSVADESMKWGNVNPPSTVGFFAKTRTLDYSQNCSATDPQTETARPCFLQLYVSLQIPKLLAHPKSCSAADSRPESARLHFCSCRFLCKDQNARSQREPQCH